MTTYIHVRLVVVVHAQRRKLSTDVRHRFGKKRYNGVVLLEAGNRLAKEVHAQTTVVFDFSQQVGHQSVVLGIRFSALVIDTVSKGIQRQIIYKYLKSSGIVTANMQLLKHSRFASFRISSFWGAGPRSSLIVRMTRFQHGSR